MIVYKGQGIDWHPQSDSLGVSPLKRTRLTHPFISSSHCLVESLRQLTCFIGCFSVSTRECGWGTSDGWSHSGLMSPALGWIVLSPHKVCELGLLVTTRQFRSKAPTDCEPMKVGGGGAPSCKPNQLTGPDCWRSGCVSAWIAELDWAGKG